MRQPQALGRLEAAPPHTLSTESSAHLARHPPRSHATEGPDLLAAFRRLLPHAGHVQFANPPGRNEPGVGDVDFGRLCSLLDEQVRT